MNIVEPIRNLEDLKLVKDILNKKSQRDYIIFSLGINSGLRISDILALDVKDVKNKTYIDIFEKKTQKQKIFPINENLKILLDKYIRNKSENTPLFLTKKSNRMERVSFYRIINNVCRQAGIDYKVGTHTLRKTFGYHHYKKFKDIAILQKIFNHSSPESTLRYIGITQDLINESYKNFVL